MCHSPEQINQTMGVRTPHVFMLSRWGAKWQKELTSQSEDLNILILVSLLLHTKVKSCLTWDKNSNSNDKRNLAKELH